jgi:hypothetical protein
MPASPLETVREALATLLATVIDGTGDYTYDLTPSGKVVQGAPPVDHKPRAPIVYIWTEVTRTEAGPELGDYDAFQEVKFAGFVAGLDNTPAGRTQAAERLGYDVFLATRSDRSLSGAVNDLQFMGWDAFDGAQENSGFNFGVVAGRIDIRHYLDGVP